jgi:aspartate/glutamate racemase
VRHLTRLGPVDADELSAPRVSPVRLVAEPFEGEPPDGASRDRRRTWAGTTIDYYRRIEVCAQEALQRGLGRLALLGTRFTMEGPFYPAVCARYGIAVVPPNDMDRAWVHERYVGELLRGEFREDTRREFISLVGRLRDVESIDGVILGGTELPLLLSTPVIAGVPALDTMALHVATIVKRLHQTDALWSDTCA